MTEKKLTREELEAQAGADGETAREGRPQAAATQTMSSRFTS